MADDDISKSETEANIAAWLYRDIAKADRAASERAEAIHKTIRDSGLDAASGACKEFLALSRLICRWKRLIFEM